MTNRYEQTFIAWDKAAQAYEDKFMDMDLYNDSYNVFCQMLPAPNARIFEVGCGPGNISKYILAQMPHAMLHGTDVAPNMVQLARQNNPTATFEVMDCRDISGINQRYHAILCGFCMPYLAKEDCEKLIADSATLLLENGVLYLSVIEGDYNQSAYQSSSDGKLKMFVYYHQADYLTAFLQQHGFALKHTIRKYYPNNNGDQQTHLILIAQKA